MPSSRIKVKIASVPFLLQGERFRDKEYNGRIVNLQLNEGIDRFVVERMMGQEDMPRRTWRVHLTQLLNCWNLRPEDR